MCIVYCLLQISFKDWLFLFFFYVADGNDISTNKHTKHEYIFKLKRLKPAKDIEKNQMSGTVLLKVSCITWLKTV